MNDLIPYEELGLTQEVMQTIKNFLAAKNEFKKIEPEIKEAFKAKVESGEIPVNSIDCGEFILSYTKGYTKNQIYSQKLKADGLYDKYLKHIEVDASVSMKIKKEEL